MELHLDCVPCMQRQVLQTARLVTDDIKVQELILRRVLDELLKSDWKTRTTMMAIRTRNIITEITGNKDPYLEVKEKYNQLAMKLYPELKQIVQNSNTPFLTSLKLSIAGNIIDFGALESFDVDETIKKVLNSPFKIDDSNYLHNKINTAKTIVYLADNTGEIVFDRLFIETIFKINPAVSITFVVKKEPFINDAMLSDAIDVGINDLPNVKLYEVGNDRCDPSFIDFLKTFDVVISKGQANFEDLKDLDFVFFLFIVKCDLVGSEINAPLGSTLVKINNKGSV